MLLGATPNNRALKEKGKERKGEGGKCHVSCPRWWRPCVDPTWTLALGICTTSRDVVMSRSVQHVAFTCVGYKQVWLLGSRSRELWGLTLFFLGWDWTRVQDQKNSEIDCSCWSRGKFRTQGVYYDRGLGPRYEKSEVVVIWHTFIGRFSTTPTHPKNFLWFD